MEIIKVNGRIYRYEYFDKCEWCDMVGTDGNCMLPENVKCERNYIFKRNDI